MIFVPVYLTSVCGVLAPLTSLQDEELCLFLANRERYRVLITVTDKNVFYCLMLMKIESKFSVLSHSMMDIHFL